MTNLKVTITEVPDPLLPDNVIAVIDGTPIVAAGKNKQEAWKELMISLAITIAHNSDLDYKELTADELKDEPLKEGSAGVWRSDQAPELVDGKKAIPRHVIAEKKTHDGKTYKSKRVAYYFPERFKSVEFEDWDDYDPKDFPYTTQDEEKGVVWLKAGWYESVNCDRCDEYWSAPLDVIEWLDESISSPAGDGWMSEKPEFKSECTFLTATRIFRSDKWNYSVWSIAKIEGDDGWYLGIVDGTGDEWGDIEDLTADMYLILPSPPNKSV